MPTIVLIEKTGEIKENNIKNLKVADIYKKCNFRKKDDFDMRYTWNINKDLFISVFSRNDGKSGTENKYDLPPPIDKDLYFGSIAIVAHKSKKISDNNIIDFSKELWNKTYEKLMGGFEDLNGEDSYSEEEEIPEDLKTSQGYMKDGFVVDDDEEEDDDEEDEDDDEEDTILTSEECDEDDDEDIDDHENIDDDEDIDEEGIDEEDIDEEDIDEEDIDDEDVGDEDGIDEEDEDGENEDGEGIYKTNFKIKNKPQRKAKKGKKSKKTKVNLLADISSGCDADEETNNDIHSELSEEEYQYLSLIHI